MFKNDIYARTMKKNGKSWTTKYLQKVIAVVKKKKEEKVKRKPKKKK